MYGIICWAFNVNYIFFRNKLYPGSSTKSPDIRTTDDKFLVEVFYNSDKDQLINLLKEI